ncbi:MAG: spondin domain-containing protein [Pseudomonadota bacterium]
MNIRIAYANDSDNGGTFTTPVWFGLHGEAFDLFNVGEEASVGLERIAEDGTFADIATELAAADPNGQGGVLFGSNIPPVAPGDVASGVVEVLDPSATPFLSAAAMILPSNDAFIGTDEALVIFEDGEFLGEQNILVTGNDIYDAGTEVNTETEAAFLNQTGPNSGLDQREAGSVITKHPGFIGSEGNPASEFPGQILGGTNAVGAFIDPEAADFTIDRGAPIGELHVNVVNDYTGTDEGDAFFGGAEDDFVDGGLGADALFGGRGWDVINGGEDNDLIVGNSGRDSLSGDEGNDSLRGGAENDTLDGGDNNDRVNGGAGDDIVSGGAGNDNLRGGTGQDTFDIDLGDGANRLRDFTQGLDVVDISDFGTAFDALTIVDGARGAELTLSDGTEVVFVGVAAGDLTESDFIF